MALVQELIKEIEEETASTKKMLERVPEEKFSWHPHEKAMLLKSLAMHIAGLAAMPGMIAATDQIDLADGAFKTPAVTTRAEIVAHFEEGTRNSLEALKKLQDEDLKKEWEFKFGDRVILKAAKGVAIRKMGLSHLYHHRAQLGVYLRLLNIAVPGMYGPSADDKA